MAESPESLPEPAANDEQQLRKQLLSRIAIAGVVIVALLGGLAVLDALNRPPVPARVAQAPIPEAAPKADDKPTEAAGEAKPEAKQDAKEEVKEASAEGGRIAEARAAPEHTSAPAGPGTRADKPLTPPATARPAAIRPSQPIAPGKPDTAQELAKVLPPPAAGQPRAASQQRPLSPPLSQAVGSARHYVVQLGVFSNVANAEELRARLELHGIAAQIEARVHVGPFVTRDEADAMRAKLRDLGMEPGIVTATRR